MFAVTPSVPPLPLKVRKAGEEVAVPKSPAAAIFNVALLVMVVPPE